MTAPQTFPAEALGAAGEALVRAAQSGEARIRDLNGGELVVLPADRARWLLTVTEAAAQLAALQTMLDGAGGLAIGQPHPSWPWLSVFDADDLAEFMTALNAAILAAARSGSATEIERALHEWQVTAEVISDPETRAILLAPHRDEDFVEVERPG